MFRIIQKNIKNKIKYVRYFKRPVVESDFDSYHIKNNLKIVKDEKEENIKNKNNYGKYLYKGKYGNSIYAAEKNSYKEQK